MRITILVCAFAASLISVAAQQAAPKRQTAKPPAAKQPATQHEHGAAIKGAGTLPTADPRGRGRASITC
jgi:hypothetical protein